jgi:hypothetical protein
MPTQKPKVPKEADDKDQSERFIKASREVETDEDPEAFEKAFRAVSKARPAPKKSKAKG